VNVIYDVKGKSIMATTYTDPVCGMEVTPETAAATSEYQGRTYYFCSVEDKETFDKNPERYVQPEQKSTSG
jgi:YHS domain-containing protein